MTKVLRKGSFTRREMLATVAGAAALRVGRGAAVVTGASAAAGHPQGRGDDPEAQSRADSWPQFRGEPRLRGVAASAPAALSVVWTHEAGEAVESSAAIAMGVVYVGVASGRLVALDFKTGARLWTYETGAEIGESSPCVAGGLVYIGDLGGTLHAVATRDGQRAWTFKTRTEVKSSPVVVDGKVLIGSYDQNLYALDAKTGAKAWAFETEGQVHATAAVLDGLALITGCDALLRAIRVSDGKEQYQVSSGAYTGASPAVVGQRAYYGTFEHEVLGVDLAERKVLWRYKPTERQFPFYSSAAVDGGKVVLGGRDKLVHCLLAETGHVLWTFPTKGRVDSSPVIAGGRLHVGSADGRVYALDLATGKSILEFDAGGPITASPALAGGRLVIGTQDGQVFCLGQKT